MPYQINGVNYTNPDYNPYPANPSLPYTYPTYPFTPSYTPVQQPNVAQTTYGTSTPGTSAPVRGRMVKADTDISPSDVPMDGFSSYFPAEDGSCIYVKHWDKDGKIQTTKFVPVPSDASDFTSSASFEDEMRERFDNLERLLKQRNNHKQKYCKQPTNQSPKEGEQ